MKIEASNVAEYLAKVPIERKAIFEKLLTLVANHLPKGFMLDLQYGIPTWQVSLLDYPPGYHCAANTPLPFLSVASQKNFIAFYHMGLYADNRLYEWFVAEYPRHCKTKLDMGKSCIRFKKMDDIPFSLLAALCGKMTTQQWIELYENRFKK